MAVTEISPADWVCSLDRVCGVGIGAILALIAQSLLLALARLTSRSLGYGSIRLV